jgi:hypothetical protein
MGNLDGVEIIPVLTTRVKTALEAPKGKPLFKMR